MRTRRLGVGIALVVAVTAALGVGWSVAGRRHREALSQVDRDMAAGRYGAARQRLVGLSTRWMGPDEVDYRLGLCEGSLGRDAAALEAWGRLPTRSAFAEAAALNSAAVEMNRGRFAAAEPILAGALARPGRQVLSVVQVLSRLLWQEGRTDERRAVLEAGWRHASRPDWPRPEEALGLLRDHIGVDLQSRPVDALRTILDGAGRQAPDDDRVWLGWAHLAIDAGQLAEARRRLDACLGRRPDDPAVWQAVLDWGLAAERVDQVRLALAHLPAEPSPPGRVEALRAWLAARRGDAAAEQRALERLVQDQPGDCAAWERLAVLAAQAGEVERAAQLRRRKAAMDGVKDRYRYLYNVNRFVDDAPELARLAEELGRPFETVGFLTWIARREPGNPAVRDTLARLRSAKARPGTPGQTLAQVLAADLAPEADRRRAHPEPREPAPLRFRDGAPVAGLSFVYESGASSGHQLPEFAGGGVGLIDYDGDGWLDVYLVQGGRFPPHGTASRAVDGPGPGPFPGRVRANSGDRLFRNRRDGTFEDVTDASGIAAMARGYGHGVAVGDYDNDGRADLFVTRWRSYALYRNRGDGRFEDVTERAGLSGDRDWPTSAAFADLDNDGDLDLYVCHYLQWDAENPRICYDVPPRRAVVGCNPREFEPLPDHVFRNDRGRFTDVTAAAGLLEHQGRGLGVVAADLDDDRRVDLFVANDQSANDLYLNRGGFRFEELAQAAGVAANAEGGYQAGMGVACGDLDGDGRLDLAVTNFYGESTTFFHNLGQGAFADRTAAVGLAAPSRHLLGFGIAFLDVDNDGRLDLMTANGHVDDYRPSIPYTMPIQLLRGGADGRLQDVSGRAGPPFLLPHLGRGLAAGDLDNDGRIDALVVAHDEPLVFLHNQTPAGHFVTFALEGTASNRDGVGASVVVVSGPERRLAQRVGGGSYQSAGDPRLHIGLGDARSIDAVEVRWPSGRVDRYRDLPVDAGYLLREGDARVRPLPGWR
jgi:tetratricopeptide (TPR) repeat protein